MQKKKILFVCYGDSNSPKAWSNVPFLFSKNLEKLGFEIICLDISPNEKAETLWNKYSGKILAKFWPDQQYSFIKTPMSRAIAYQKIKKAVKSHPDLYYCIFLTFDFYNKFNDVPSLLLHDWSYDMVILDRLQRQPYFFEKWTIANQRKALNNSEIAISLFKDAQKIITERHGKPVKHLGYNVVNDLNDKKLARQEILDTKFNSRQLLLVGSMKYLHGARKLVQALRILQKDFPDLGANIINIPKERLLLEETDRNIHCYPYLDKGIPEEKRQYYDLLINAKILVNPSETWAAYSSTIECMYNYTPVIIKPYEAFTMDYGEKSNFGVYLDNTEIPTIVEAIRKVLTMPRESYSALCECAHEHVKDQTWENYTKKVVEIMAENINQ